MAFPNHHPTCPPEILRKVARRSHWYSIILKCLSFEKDEDGDAKASKGQGTFNCCAKMERLKIRVSMILSGLLSLYIQIFLYKINSADVKHGLSTVEFTACLLISNQEQLRQWSKWFFVGRLLRRQGDVKEMFSQMSNSFERGIMQLPSMNIF